MGKAGKREEHRERWRRFQGCERKEAHETEDDAKAVVSAVAYSQRTSVKTLEPYKCRFCGLWHVGHP